MSQWVRHGEGETESRERRAETKGDQGTGCAGGDASRQAAETCLGREGLGDGERTATRPERQVLWTPRASQRLWPHLLNLGASAKNGVCVGGVAGGWGCWEQSGRTPWKGQLGTGGGKGSVSGARKADSKEAGDQLTMAEMAPLYLAMGRDLGSALARLVGRLWTASGQ